MCPAELKARGLIKSVATTNMDVQALQALLDAGVPVAANQVRVGAGCEKGQGEPLDFSSPHLVMRARGP